jgi:hypothetical protein
MHDLYTLARQDTSHPLAQIGVTPSRMAVQDQYPHKYALCDEVASGGQDRSDSRLLCFRIARSQGLISTESDPENRIAALVRPRLVGADREKDRRIEAELSVHMWGNTCKPLDRSGVAYP